MEMKQSIAQKKANGNKSGRSFLGPLSVCAPLGGLAYICKEVVPGYSFTAFVCLGIIGVILFYTFMPAVGHVFPRFEKIVTGWFTALLCIGLLAAGITEYYIIRASFGDPGKPVDYAVVLGAKVREDGPSISLMDRIQGAYAYLNDHPGVIAVVSGGQGADEHMTEAQCMFDELTAMGIPAGRILLEEKSSNTRENLMFSLDVIQEKTGVRPDKLAIVSSEYHLLRAGMVAKNCGVEAVGVPARTSRVTQLINHCMREIAAVWKYAILGGNGND